MATHSLESLKVVNVLPMLSARGGGPPYFVAESAVYLPALGVEPTIFATQLANLPGHFNAQRVRPEELPDVTRHLDVQLFPTRPSHRLAYSPELRAGLRQSISQYDLVHIHSLWLYPQYAAYREALAHGVPYIVSPHGALDPFLRKRGRFRKALTNVLWQSRMLERASAIHVVAEEEATLMEDIAPSVPRWFVPCGINVERFQELPDRDRFRGRYLNDHSGPLILFLGRVTFKKGLDILIRAFARTRIEVPGAHLAVVGPDDESLTDGLRSLADSLGVVDAVTFTGPLYGAARLEALAAADLWALSSHAEALPIAVLEALAAGVPTVISPAINIARDLQQAGAAEVAELRPQAFADVLISVLTSPEKRTALSNSARAFANRYNWATIAPELARFYSEVVDRFPSRQRFGPSPSAL